jgi:hypothetical protein
MKGIDQHGMASVPTAEGAAYQTSQQQRAEVTNILENYLDTIESLWNASPQEKAQEYRRLKLLLKYQLAMSCPVPVYLSIMEKSDKEQTDGASSGTSKEIHLSPALMKKVAKAATTLRCSPDDAISAILAEGVGKYVKTGLLSDDKEEEEADEIDI